MLGDLAFLPQFWTGAKPMPSIRGVTADGALTVDEPTNVIGLTDKAEEAAVTIETPRAALLDDLDVRLVVLVEQLVPNLARGLLACEFDSHSSMPVDVDNADEGGWLYPAHRSTRVEILESRHISPPQTSEYNGGPERIEANRQGSIESNCLDGPDSPSMDPVENEHTSFCVVE